MFSRCFLAASKVHARRSFRGIAQLANADGLERGEEEIFPDLASRPLADRWRAGVNKLLEGQFAGLAH